MLREYRYILVNAVEQREISTAVPPEMLVQEVIMLFEMVGVNRPGLTIYLQQDDTRQPVYGGQDVSATVSLGSFAEPLAGTAPRLSEDDSVVLGKRLVKAYLLLRRRYIHLKAQQDRVAVVEERAKLARLLDLVEMSVKGGEEMEQIFDLWLKKQYRPVKCMAVMHVERTTWYRKRRALIRHIAYALTDQLDDGTIRALLSATARVGDWMSLLNLDQQLEESEE